MKLRLNVALDPRSPPRFLALVPHRGAMMAEFDLDGAPNEEDGDWILPLQGHLVTRCLIDHGFSLQGEGESGSSFLLRIEGEFVLTGPEKTVELSATRPTELGIALGLLGKSIASGQASRSGRLDLGFSDRTALVVLSHPHYEAWQLTGPRGLRVVAMPGGKLAVWPPTEGQHS